MPVTDPVLCIDFENSGQSQQIPLSRLEAGVIQCLDQFGSPRLLGPDAAQRLGREDGTGQLSRLMEACGYAGDPQGFFQALLVQLGAADGIAPVAINQVPIPHLVLMAVLEQILPGNRFISVKSVEQLEQVANLTVPADQQEAMQAVLETYPVRLSMHTIRQMRISGSVAYQYLPFVEEMDPAGHTNTWIGQFHQGLLEQMYENRVIFLLNMSCPVYCRFCFRKHKSSRNEANPTVGDVRRAVAHVADSPGIKEIVLTGGDPLMNRANLAAAMDGLMEIDHVQTLRLASRSVAYYPHLFLGEEQELLDYLKTKSLELQQRGKRMELATHFIHPDEVSPQSLAIITELVRSGISVYVQTPFLNNCNDQGPELVRLFGLLRGAGAEMHYIYIPCSPIHGNSVYWAPIDRGLAVGRYLRAHLSDRAIPRICTATPIGKIDWHTSGWAVEPVADNERFIWVRTPYTPDYFKNFAPLASQLDNIRLNAEGTIDVQYMARMGDDALFLGSRPTPEWQRSRQLQPLADVLPDAMHAEPLAPSIVASPSNSLSRVHATRVELAPDCSDADLRYIRDDSRISDVVVVSLADAVDELFAIRRIARFLADCPQVNALRLRSFHVSDQPQRFTPGLVDALAGLHRLTIADSLRMEIETRFLTAEQIGPEHVRLTRRLNNQGISVYVNTPLLGGINDTPDAIGELAYAIRRAGMEFHHLYIAGLLIQERWNQENPVDLADVVDIATRVRREGSGREVPRYMVRTVLGEADFGLSATIDGDGQQLAATLLPYDCDYYRALDSQFSWPQGVREDGDGHPVVSIVGLVKTTDFSLG